MNKRKVALFLMGEKGLRVLESLINKNLTEVIETTVIAKDKNVINDYSAELEFLCRSKGISYTFRNKQKHFDSDLYIAISWRWIIKLEPGKKLIVFHESLLPKYRGFAPLVNQLINGEKEIGVTALLANKEFDKGPILFQEKIPIRYPIKIQKAIEIVAPIYAQIAVQLLNLYIKGDKILEREQNEAFATYSLWRDEEDYRIDWNADSEKIKRFIDAVGYPYSGACTEMDRSLICIKDAEVVEDVFIENRTAGKILFMKEGKPIVVCGKGMLQINDAAHIEKQESIFPLTKFRLRLK